MGKDAASLRESSRPSSVASVGLSSNQSRLQRATQVVGCHLRTCFGRAEVVNAAKGKDMLGQPELEQI